MTPDDLITPGLPGGDSEKGAQLGESSSVFLAGNAMQHKSGGDPAAGPVRQGQRAWNVARKVTCDATASPVDVRAQHSSHPGLLMPGCALRLTRTGCGESAGDLEALGGPDATAQRGDDGPCLNCPVFNTSRTPIRPIPQEGS